MYKNEREVAKKAEKMLEASLRQKTNSFKDHVSRAEGDISLKNATAKARLKKYGSRRNGNITHYMRSLAIVMPQHGFIQHFGVDAVRSGGSRNRTKPNNVRYNFKAHTMKMKPHPFINSAVTNSGVIDFVMENVAKIRSEELLLEVKKIMENK